ncbi:D-(-)-3-hydroxybutyrate oligomer hydrolase [Dirofilaria immitis]
MKRLGLYSNSFFRHKNGILYFMTSGKKVVYEMKSEEPIVHIKGGEKSVIQWKGRGKPVVYFEGRGKTVVILNKTGKPITHSDKIKKPTEDEGTNEQGFQEICYSGVTAQSVLKCSKGLFCYKRITRSDILPLPHGYDSKL